MLKLETLKPDLVVSGLLTDRNVKICYVTHSGDAATVIYSYDDDKGPQVAQAVLLRSQEPDLTAVESETPFSADPERFKLAIEARRIQWAYLFDPMMAVNSSVVTPLPHQISAVYESMLPKQPLRFLLADDPGAGKTIMAGLLVKELIMRADVQRVLIVSPGSLTAQWQDELHEKFGLEFEIFSPDKRENSASGNPFMESGNWIVRLDQFSRTEPVNHQALVAEVDWDLVIIDEAHKVAAHYSGNKVQRTRRSRFAEMLSNHTRHFLLMTATPHNGKEEDFQLFLSLLDPDRFYGRSKVKLGEDALHDIMRRMVKEDMRKFDGSRLFPERVAHTVTFTLSPEEAALYQSVTNYVRHEMNRAEKVLNESKKNVVGFALTLLQRRLASSPEAIHRSLLRRLNRLEALHADWLAHPGHIERYAEQWYGNNKAETKCIEDLDDEDDLTANERENLENSEFANATSSKTILELAAEIAVLKGLESLAKAVCLSNRDSKWSSLSELLQSRGDNGEPIMNRKLIIFTEHKDTLEYLKRKITSLTGSDRSVVTIDGSVGRDDRCRIQDAFRNDPDVRFFIATDAAGEGINLQNTNYMINYDLPWNPNRIEQRFGRIHRIGQTEVCHLWNLVARDTREGEVFNRLFEKLRQQKADLGDRVFDVLGDIFGGNMSLRDVLLDSIRNDDEKRRQFLLEKIDMAMERRHIEEVLDQNALCQADLGTDRLRLIKRKMDEAEARRLQPCYVSAFFRNAFAQLGGTMMPRETNRYQIKRVPQRLRNFHSVTRDGHPVRSFISPVYERVCFDKSAIESPDRGRARAEFLHPGHPLMQSVISATIADCRNEIALGALFVDDRDDLSTEPRLLSLIELGVKESNSKDRFVARRMLFLWTHPDGTVSDAGPAPHLDLRSPTEEESRLLNGKLGDLARLAQSFATIQPEMLRQNKTFFDSVSESRIHQVEHEREQVETRLKSAIRVCDDKLADLLIRRETKPRATDEANIQKLRNQMDDLKHRLESRLTKLRGEEKLLSMPPSTYSSALVIPKGYFLKLMGTPVSAPDVLERRRIEHIAMKAVMEAEKALGHVVVDCSRENKGWDVESTIASTGEIRHIEVKGIHRKDNRREQITVSRNEWLQGHNLGNKFLLAYVIVDADDHTEPRYVRNPFKNQPDDVDTQKSLDVRQLELISKNAGEA